MAFLGITTTQDSHAGTRRKDPVCDGPPLLDLRAMAPRHDVRPV